MSLFPKTCPHCDAGPGRYVNIYLCGTYLRAGEDDRKLQTKRCTARERARLIARVAELEARCKRLEEAGDRLEWRIACGCGQGVPCGHCANTLEAWQQAKEAKP